MYNSNLKQLRKNNNKRQVDIAILMNIDESTYRNYENERDIFPIKHLTFLCDYFKVSMDYLLGLSIENNYKSLNNQKVSKEIIGKNLKNIRVKLNIKQETLEKETGFDRSSISQYENGNTVIPTLLLYSICKKYNVSADYVLGRSKELFINK